MKKILKIAVIIFLFVCIAALFAACGESNISGVSFSSASYDFDGNEKTLTVSGTLPAGVTATYTNNVGTNAGEYRASVTLSGDGYKTLVLNATLTINKISITGVSFSSASYDFDGNEKTLSVTGTLPQGASVSYSSNKGTNAGIYNASATVSGANYNTLNLNATLTINKIDITGVSFSPQSFDYDGETKSLLIEGTPPQGVTVSYDGNGRIDPGSYDVSVTLTGANYNSLTITKVMDIVLTWRSYSKLAQEYFSRLIVMPDAYSFFPQMLKKENRFAHYEHSPLDFSSFVGVSAIASCGIGEQLNAFYNSVTLINEITSRLTTYYAVISQVLTLYQQYLTAEPTQLTHFEAAMEEGLYSVTFDLTLTSAALEVTAGSFKLSTYVEKVEGEYSIQGYIKITEGNEMRFEITGSSIEIGILAAGVNRTYVKFYTSEGVSYGSVFVYWGTEILGYDIGTVQRAEFLSNENYTCVIGKNGDSYLGATDMRNMEVYRNYDGNLIGSYIYEETEISGVSVTFNTLWLPLNALTGIEDIKIIIDTKNGNNPDSVYINQSTTKFKSKNIGGLSAKMFSRRYDIELRKTYYYIFDQTEQKYQRVEEELPFIFIQQEQLANFITDVNGENNGNIAFNNDFISQQEREVMASYYTTMLQQYADGAEITKEYIEDYVQGE